MHELSLCRSIAAIAERHRAGRRVVRVGIRLGAFRQAVPETLRYCWSLVTQDTGLAGSELDFEIVPLRVRCRECGATTELREVWLRCPECGASAVEVISGDEFLVTALEVAD